MKTKVTDREKRDTYLRVFGKEFDDINRKQSPLPLDIAYQVALSAIERGKLNKGIFKNKTDE